MPGDKHGIYLCLLGISMSALRKGTYADPH